MSLICIIGNSHIGALAQSSDGIRRLRDKGHEVVFWGVAGQNFQKIAVDGHLLRSPNPKHSLIVSEGRFEHLDLRVPDVMMFYAFNVSPSYQSRRMALAMQQARHVTSGLQQALEAEMLQTWWSGSLARNVIDRISTAFPDKTYGFAAQPLFAPNDDYLDKIEDPGLVRHFQGRILGRCERWMTEHNVRFIAQPDETREGDFFTKAIYTKGSARLATGEQHETEDFAHMNAAYGEIMLGRIAQTLL